LIVNISFVETEHCEQEYFAQELADHELEFVDRIGEVSSDSEIVSVFISSQIDDAFLDAHPAVRLIATRSTTLDHIDWQACRRRGVTVCAIHSYGDHTVAEHTFALLLGLSRRLRDVMEGQRQGGFSFDALRGFELRGKVIGLIGAGRIGRQVIPIAQSFGMPVIVCDPYLGATGKELGVPNVSLDELLSRSDIISLHATLTPETCHLLNRETLGKCRPGVIILNTARGGLIDTAALSEALASGQVAGAGIDVLEAENVMREEATNIVAAEIVERLHSPFTPTELRDPAHLRHFCDLMHSETILNRRNVVFTPHIAFNSQEAIDRINRETVANIRAFIAERNEHEDCPTQENAPAGACREARPVSGCLRSLHSDSDVRPGS
jgi:D-lactate dehydrogenase